jgi:hypothetical protein
MSDVAAVVPTAVLLVRRRCKDGHIEVQKTGAPEPTWVFSLIHFGVRTVMRTFALHLMTAAEAEEVRRWMQVQWRAVQKQKYGRRPRRDRRDRQRPSNHLRRR